MFDVACGCADRIGKWGDTMPDDDVLGDDLAKNLKGAHEHTRQKVLIGKQDLQEPDVFDMILGLWTQCERASIGHRQWRPKGLSVA